MKTAIAIARVSTEEQARERRTSLATQVAEIEAWCSREGYEVVDRVEERGVSVSGDLDPEGTPRPFWSAYARLRSGEVDALVFHGQDRLSRSREPLRVALLLAEARRFGDGIRFVREDQVSDDPDVAGLVDYVRAISTKQDAERRREATMRGVGAKWAKGVWASGTPPLGYRWDEAAGRLVIDEAQAEIVRMVHRLYADGNLGAERIASRLNQQGVLPPAAAKGWRSGPTVVWNRGAVARLLKKHDYSASVYVRTYGGREYVFEVEPLVDTATRARVEEVRAGRPFVAHDGGVRKRVYGNGRGRTGDRGLLQGRLTCGCCDRRLQTGYTGGPNHRRVSYHCPNTLASRRRFRDEPCDLPRRMASELDSRVWAEVVRALRDGATLQGAADQYLDRLEDRIAAGNPALMRARDELDDLRAQRQRAIDAEIRYGTDAMAVVTEIDARVESLEAALKNHAREAAELVRLREERARIHEAIRKYGGAVTLVDSDDSDEVTLVYRRDRGADEFGAGGFMNLLGATRGTERRTRADLVDLLDLAVKVYPERAEISGVLGDITMPLSPA